MLHCFGIRHHGPGCARSLVRAMQALRPDCVLVEGPPEGDSLIPLVAAQGMQPPVALLSYCPEEPQLAVYHPFAEFSPEWQALRWAVAQGVPARFIDLPRVNDLALNKAQRQLAAGAPEPAAEEETPPQQRSDPLDWLARAAGYGDGEAWWNHMVEERGDGEQLFAAIEEAMLTLRQAGVEHGHDPEDSEREILREAHMRQCIRSAQKQGFERIAIVCGAWHLAGLKQDSTAKADAALLKALPKLKVNTTWVPWTYRHLLRASGYGAGIRSPGWYEHLWRCSDASQPRAVGWLARVARLMRARATWIVLRHT